jgi:hypothetical protein
LEAQSVERKLAAIFAADVEGYSRLMGWDEVGTLRLLTAYRVIIDRLNKPLDAKQVGRELGVRYLLEGSVRQTGDQVRVNVQLIDAETGAHAWADRFDTNRANLAEAQDEIIGRLARSLHLELVRDAPKKT